MRFIKNTIEVNSSMTVAEMIKKTRIDENMTQEEYGLKFGVTRQTVSSWENERSLPDLQMLINICNTYHVSLDKLLNEDHDFVQKIDIRKKVTKLLRAVLVIAAIVLILFAAMFFKWKITSSAQNEKFADTATELGFKLDGTYVYENDNVKFTLPNQKVPFMKSDFMVKQVTAEFELEYRDISILLFEDYTFSITFNHHRQIQGQINQSGDFIVSSSDLSPDEEEIYSKHSQKIAAVLNQLFTIHNTVYP